MKLYIFVNERKKHIFINDKQNIYICEEIHIHKTKYKTQNIKFIGTIEIENIYDLTEIYPIIKKCTKIYFCFDKNCKYSNYFSLEWIPMNIKFVIFNDFCPPFNKHGLFIPLKHNLKSIYFKNFNNKINGLSSNITNISLLRNCNQKINNLPNMCSNIIIGSYSFKQQIFYLPNSLKFLRNNNYIKCISHLPTFIEILEIKYPLCCNPKYTYKIKKRIKIPFHLKRLKIENDKIELKYPFYIDEYYLK